MLRTEKVRLADWYRGIREVTKQLDETNIKILTAMWKHGPRNLLEVSRRTHIPFTSVYHRVAKLEAKSKRFVYLVPQISKLGLVRAAVLIAARPGAEEKVTAALKLPNVWRSVTPCEGNFTHLSIHAVPVKHLKEFRAYIKRLSDLTLVTESRVMVTGDLIPNFPNFTYYNAASNQWRFEWGHWLKALGNKPSESLEDPASYAMLANTKDLIIIKELEKNARRSFAELSPLLRISLQGVKYHYDKKLVPSGIVKYFAFDTVPYPLEVAACHEIMLKFSSSSAMNKFYSLAPDLFFVLATAKVLHERILLVRTYMLQTQVANMFSFFSQMAKMRMLESYSSVRLDISRREMKTISYELFNEETGWTLDIRKCLADLSKLARTASVRQKV
jgi:DNA-binding Lrp family transcriptional regulator